MITLLGNSIKITSFSLRCFLIVYTVQFAALFWVFGKYPKSWVLVASIVPFLGFLVVFFFISTQKSYLVRPEERSARDHFFYLPPNIFNFFIVVAFLPLIPDVLLSIKYATSTLDVRTILLRADTFRLLPYQLLIFLQTIWYSVCTFIFVWCRFQYRNKLIKAFLVLSVILVSLLFASRTDILQFAIFILLASVYTFKRLISALAFIMLLVFFLLAYTLFFQGRGGSNASLFDFSDTLLFYFGYFAYPFFMSEGITDVFGQIPFGYAYGGYIYDVLTAFLSGSAQRTVFMQLFTERFPLGLDQFGQLHSYANVLYPHFAFLWLASGFPGSLLFYILFFSLVIILSRTAKYVPLSFFLVFLVVYQSSMTFTMATPQYIVSAVVVATLCYSSRRYRL